MPLLQVINIGAAVLPPPQKLPHGRRRLQTSASGAKPLYRYAMASRLLMPIRTLLPLALRVRLLILSAIPMLDTLFNTAWIDLFLAARESVGNLVG